MLSVRDRCRPCDGVCLSLQTADFFEQDLSKLATSTRTTGIDTMCALKKYDGVRFIEHARIIRVRVQHLSIDTAVVQEHTACTLFLQCFADILRISYTNYFTASTMTGVQLRLCCIVRSIVQV